MNQEYYGSADAPFADLADAMSGIELTEQMVVEAARRIYDNQESASELDVQMYEAVLASFHNAIAEGLTDAISSGTGAVSDEFLEQLRSSNEVFSTFKVHRMQRDITSQLFTAEGKLKSRSRFVKDVLPVASHHVKAWLRTEYDTAVLRAHQAADWLQFERDKDILPNLRWMPSTSITPGEDHRVFWNTVLPIEHRFWSVHRPGDRWNCKCRLEATDDAPTAVPMVEKNDKKNNPARGLENNPAKDGHIFSNKHSYFPSSCSTCPYGTKKGNLFALAAKKKGDCYACARVASCLKKIKAKEISEKKANFMTIIRARELADKRPGGLISVKSLQTGMMLDSRKSFMTLYNHTKYVHEVKAMLSVFIKPSKLKFIRKSPFGEGKDKNNFDDQINLATKRKKKVSHYNVYEIKTSNGLYVLKTEVRKNKFEIPYFIRKK